MKQLTIVLWFCSCLYGVERVVYPYSIVPGGITNDVEIQRAKTDPLIAAHYAHIGSVTATKVLFNTHAYVSELQNGNIHWKPMIIPAGEDVLTDGKHLIRVRCGNLIVFTMPPPTDTIAPPEDAELVPPSPWIAPPVATVSVPPESSPPFITPSPTTPTPFWVAAPWGLPLIGGGGGWGPTCPDNDKECWCYINKNCKPHPPVPPVPEPSTMFLAMAGFIVAQLARRVSR